MEQRNYASNRGRWTPIVRHLEKQVVYVTLTKSIDLTFPNVFVEYYIPNHNSQSEVFKRWVDQYFRFWQSQLSFAVHCATTALGISAEQLTNRKPFPMINAIYRFHAYYHIRRVLFFLESPLPYEDGFDRYDNNYSKAGFEKMCDEYGADIQTLYKFESQSASWQENDATHSPGWWQTENGDYAKWIMPTSKGLTEKGLTKLSESIRIYAKILLGSQAQSRASILGSNASNTTARQVYLQELETQIRRAENIQSDIAVFQKLLKYARTPINLVIEPRCYMIPSDMELKMGKIEDYNNNILIAPKDARVGVMVSINTKTPTSTPKRPDPKRPASTPTTSSPKTPVSAAQAEQHENEKTALLIGGTSLILLGLYLRH